ncbi:MAG TPA: hypothetical protein PKA28_10725 [Methylomusa anaerophila]|nr:hypothetical protein [Methylomusa anaerophila]HML88908.1 hypothetical protein [Methylomusa anaerophila]
MTLDNLIDTVFEAYIYDEPVDNNTLGWIHQYLMELQDKREWKEGEIA